MITITAIFLFVLSLMGLFMAHALFAADREIRQLKAEIKALKRGIIIHDRNSA